MLKRLKPRSVLMMTAATMCLVSPLSLPTLAKTMPEVGAYANLESSRLIRLPELHQLSVSKSLFDGWHFSLSAPVVFGAGAVPTMGIQAGKTFPLGLGLGLGISSSAFMPLNFQSLYLNSSLGLSHGVPLGPLYLDYGLRYAGLFEARFSETNPGSSYYHGPLANLGLRLSTGNTSTYLGVQAGFYAPVTGVLTEPIWVLQPIWGVNVNL